LTCHHCRTFNEEYIMRSLIAFAALATATMFGFAAPASANWSCDGPEYVCGSAPQASSYKKSGKVSYKTSKSYDTASADAPVKHKKQKRSYDYSYDGGSSYQSGMASYYWEPQMLASGGRFNPNALTAAHKTLPFGTRVRVTNTRNGESVVVTINDRGPYVGGRVIDLSRAAAKAISITGSGVAPVKLAVLGRG
jgi:rare lipoprotein A